MASTNVDICNLALANLGDGFVSAMTDNTKAAKICQQIYGHCRKTLLQRAPWAFALALSGPLTETDTPAFGFGHAYILPGDCLTVHALNLSGHPWRIAGEVLHTSLDGSALADGLRVEYVRDTEAVEDFSQAFAEALVLLITWRLVMPVTGKRNDALFWRNEYERAVYTAIHANALEQQGRTPGRENPDTADSWLNARGGASNADERAPYA